MERSFLIIVSDDVSTVEKAKMWGQSLGIHVKVYTHAQYSQEHGAKAAVNSGSSSVTMGNLPGANVLPFPGQNSPVPVNNHPGQKRVATINELESIAIENAIYEYNGNLTEAARALGIGRATLYRKVKQYNIDPSAARKKRRAA